MNNETLSMNDHQIAFEHLSIDHFILLHKWIQEPHVWQWWGEGKSWTSDEIKEKYSSYTLGYKSREELKKRSILSLLSFKENLSDSFSFIMLLTFLGMDLM